MINYKLTRNQRNEEIRKRITKRLRDIRRVLSNNGDADLQVEYESLHKLIKKPLPKDYESHYYD